MDRWLEILLIMPGFIFGLTIHEAAHALSAKRLGDGYSASRGRISLNPLRHLSPLGTLAILVLGFGWAKPVEVNPYNFEKPKLHMLLTALAGPASNILLMLLISLVLRLVPIQGRVLYVILFLAAYINGVLALLNLLPIPPLDGSRIWPLLVPKLKLVDRSRLNLVWVGLLIVALRTNLLDSLFRFVVRTVTILVG